MRVPIVRLPLWKRGVDIAVAGVGLVVLSPLLGLVALGSRVFLGPGVLFRQTRGGHGGELFTLLKFRSMKGEFGEDGQRLSLLDRRHWWGEFLRRTSIDEIPALINVARGEMSLVGPRPLLEIYLDRYTQAQAQRHRMPPGITGLAQVEGRNLVSWDRKFELDNLYIETCSPVVDLRILGKTAWQILTPWIDRGTADHAPEFLGEAS